MKHNFFETLFGAVIILVAAVFFVYAYQKSDVVQTNQYTYSADFNSIEGIVVGSDVRLAGVKVGTVLKTYVDPKSYLAVVELTAEDKIKLPEDTAAQIKSDGLLGNKYVALSPGGSEKNLKPGDRITYTQSAVNLEDLIGKAIFSNSDNKKN